MNKDLTQGGNFAILPARIRYDKNLTDSEKILFCELTALSNKNGYCYAGNKYLSELYGVTKETISRRLSRLEKKGYVKIQLQREGKEIKGRHIYPLMDSSIPIDANVNTPHDATVKTPIDANVKENNLINNNLNTNKLKENKETDPLFEKWWKLYPKKNKVKADVKKKFDKALKEVGEEHLFKATEIYLKTQDDIQYICNPYKFFHQEYYSQDAVETYRQILDSAAKEKVNQFKPSNKPNAYAENEQLLEDRKKQREADMRSGYLPF